MANSVSLTPSDYQLPSLYRWEKQRVDKIFLTQPQGGGATQDITWAQAGQEARRMATWLIAQGYPPGSNIAILGKNSAHWILADLAIWMAGHVSVPIYPTFNAQALRYILDHSESKACFVGKLDDTDSLADGIPKGMPLIALPLSPGSVATKFKASTWESLIAANAPLEGEPMGDVEAMCTIIYTSGTTGNPKGVMHSFKSMAWGLKSATGKGRVQMSVDDQLLSYLPLAHVAERMLIEQGALINGSHIFFAESLDTFVKDLGRARPTVFFSVPRLWVKFQQGIHTKFPPKKLNFLLGLPIIGGLVRRKILKGLGLDNCRLAAGGAAPMPPDMLRWYRDIGLDLIEVYGMTENSGVSHGTLPGTMRPGTVGMPYEGVESRIDKETGEIQMRAPCLMLGYYKDPQQTADTFTSDGWLHTGDKGQIEADGSLRITGRVKDIFKSSKGKYVAPAPIEDLLVNHPDVEACAVTGANFAQPLAIIMLSADALNRSESPAGRVAITESLTTHLKAVNSRLEAHEKLDCVAVVSTTWSPENGFVTPTFKVKRARIEESYGKYYEEWLKQRKAVVWQSSVP